ncbi:MAG: Asp23/Gls24 family envelope stress response protein [Anaerolineales bacterium]
MNPRETNPLGAIEISPQAIATIASQAVLQSYGVVGMASKNVVDGLTNILSRDPRHGVEVLVAEHGDALTINLYIIVEYGTRISVVATSVANAVRFNVEKALGVPVGEVNVHVQGLRVSNADA